MKISAISSSANTAIDPGVELTRIRSKGEVTVFSLEFGKS